MECFDEWADDLVLETRAPTPRRAVRYRWDVREIAPRDHLTSFSQGDERIHPLLIQLLWNRGIDQPDVVRDFLRGPDGVAHSPWAMQGVVEAVERVLRARQNGETVAVYGDYDVDGVTSTTVLTECLRLLGVSVIPFVPHRETDGYGLNARAIDRLKDRGASLLIAVDCGISGAPEVAHAAELGVDVVVVDHHHVPATLPGAVAVINPRQPGCDYPFKDLCGVGLAYKLARALLERGLAPAPGAGDLADRWLDLVALGTIADVVPLIGENRVLVCRGLPCLNRLDRPGLRALAQQAGVAEGKITPRTVGFGLAPRLNAAGRLDDAALSLRLLLTQSADEARELAAKIEATNRERQRLTEAALGEARELVRQREEAEGALPKLLLTVGDDYRSGIVGLVASKLVEEFRRPALVAARQDGVLRGSARSIEGFHVTEALTQCQDLLDRYGGHALAAGFSARLDRLQELQQRLEAIAGAQIPDDAIEPCLKIDAVLRLHRYSASLYRLLFPLEPFGNANPAPVFLSRGLRVAERRLMGNAPPYHLRLTLVDGNTRWNAVGWGMGDRLSRLSEQVDAVYTVDRDTWNGRDGVQLKLLDVRSEEPGIRAPSTEP